MSKLRLMIRFLEGEDGNTTDVRCVSNTSTFNLMMQDMVELSTDKATVSTITGIEFNSKVSKRITDSKAITTGARSIGNLYHENTKALRFICTDVPADTIGLFVSSFVNLKDIYMYKSDAMNINPNKLKGSSLSEIIKMNHTVTSLRLDGSGLHRSIRLAILLCESLDPNLTLKVIFDNPHVEYEANDMKALKQCVQWKSEPYPRMDLSLNLCRLESSICESKLRHDEIKDEVRTIMAPYYKQLQENFKTMAKNESTSIDGAKFVNLITEFASLTGTYMLLRNFPDMLPKPVSSTKTKRKKKGKRKSAPRANKTKKQKSKKTKRD